MPTTPARIAAEYQDTARDCAGLLDLLDDAIQATTTRHQSGAAWPETVVVQAIRHHLIDAIVFMRQSGDAPMSDLAVWAHLNQLRSDPT